MTDNGSSLPPPAIESVIAAARRGEPWRTALEAAAAAAGAQQALESIASEACGNWVWLTSFARRDVALDVGGAVSGMAAALSRHFAAVHRVEDSALLAEFAALRLAQDGLRNVTVSRASATALPFRDDAFDCVAVHGAPPGAGAGPTALRRILSECRRVLRPEGRLYLALENPAWYGRLRRPRTSRTGTRAIASAARAANLRDVQRYYAFPTFARPRVLVPGTRRAFYARETVEASGDVRRVVRRAVVLAGLYTLLGPSVVIIARK